ncbi:hypothetical protein [Nonomuraea recticatena]
MDLLHDPQPLGARLEEICLSFRVRIRFSLQDSEGRGEGGGDLPAAIVEL